MAMASAKAAPRSMGTNSFSVDSGLRPIDSIAFPTSRPMASAGPIPPTPIANAFANIFATSGSIDLRTIDRRGLFIVVYVLLKNEGCLPVRRGDTLWVSSVARNSNWVLFMTPVRLFGQDREIHERELAVDDLPHADGSRSRQEPHPVRQEDEDEQRSHERKKPFRLRPALRDLIEIPEHGLEQQLDKVLNPARDFVQRRTDPE